MLSSRTRFFPSFLTIQSLLVFKLTHKASQPKGGGHILIFQWAKQEANDVKSGDINSFLSESRKSPSLAACFPDQWQELSHAPTSELCTERKALPSMINPDSSLFFFFPKSKGKLQGTQATLWLVFYIQKITLELFSSGPLSS